MGRPLRLLSLDGGGVRGISSLYILKELMAQVARQNRIGNSLKPKIKPKPCEFFDLICGSSTGGVIALMLGRMRMSVDDAIKHYKIFSEKVFMSESTDPAVKFDHVEFERQIKAVLERMELPPEEKMLDENPNLCHTFVVATSLRGQGSIATRMRTYNDSPVDDASPASIWEAARATAASPYLFAPIFIEDIKYGDGGLGWNNPSKEAIAEALNIWPKRDIGCLVSIGTGLEDPNQFNENSEDQSLRAILEKTSAGTVRNVAVAEYCAKCLTSCEVVHQEIAAHPEISILGGNYFRLNVPQGMSKIGIDEWTKLGDMIALADGYMTQGEQVKAKQDIAKILLNPGSFTEDENILERFPAVPEHEPGSQPSAY